MLNSIWGWVLPIGFVGAILVVVFFILRYSLRRITDTQASEGFETDALVVHVEPPAQPAENGFGKYLLEMEVFPPDQDDKISLRQVPYFVGPENASEASELRPCAVVRVKINPRHNNELYVRKGTVTWDGETDLNRKRVAMGGEPEVMPA